MNQKNVEKIKRLYPELMPAVTGNNELKLFLTRDLIKSDKEHIGLIKSIEEKGFSFLREYYDITGYYMTFFKESERV